VRVETEKELLREGALELHRHGYAVELVRYGTKRAAFEAWNERDGLSRAAFLSHMRRSPYNVAIRVGTEVRGPPEGRILVAVDIDDGGLDGIDSPMIVRTARAFHAYFADVIEPKSRKWARGDLKASGYLLAPPSWNAEAEFRYEWVKGPVRPEELPPLPTDLRVSSPPEILAEPCLKPKKLVTRTVEAMRKWIRKVHAIEGQGGDRNTFRVACKICSVVRDEVEALAEILSWNAEGYAQPPWTVRELEHKIRCALKRTLE